MPDSPRDSTDVRMRGFARRTSVVDAQAWIDALPAPLGPHREELRRVAGRVLSSPIASEVNVPAFSRSMMDGFAVLAADTSGASAYNPLKLQPCGTVLPGEECSLQVTTGKCVKIMTGAALPIGADAVLPAEQVQQSPSGEDQPFVLAVGEVSPGKHIGQPGEDIQAGEVVAAAGRRMRPQDIGVLASVGVASCEVVRQPIVRIVVTGNELLPPGSKPTGVRIVDANSPILEACVRRDGGQPRCPGITPDDRGSILQAMRDEADVILVSGGSSVGQEDHAPTLLAEHGELAIHGVSIRPASPAGMGVLGKALVFLLPGNPVSCLCAYDMFAGRAIRRLAGLPREFPYRKISRPLRRKIVSQIGRVDYARVKFIDEQVEPIAISGSSVLSSTTRAAGFVLIPADCEGYPEGAEVDVWLYDGFISHPPTSPWVA